MLTGHPVKPLPVSGEVQDERHEKPARIQGGGDDDRLPLAGTEDLQFEAVHGGVGREAGAGVQNLWYGQVRK